MFIKRATANAVCSAVYDTNAEGGLKKTASEGTGTTSYFLDGAKKININEALKKVANRYAISENPANYVYEVLRGNTTNICNENYDAFHRNELLRFDTEIGSPVYMTYVGCPHHLNHKTDDPKRARGFIVDAHYNEDSAPMPVCPTCNSPTADESARDASGIYCKLCATPVKDEFVEILVAVDAEKDPLFAKAVQDGSLNAVSMGCLARSTSCNVCDNVAHTERDFCAHIQASAKGSLWKREGNKFERTTLEFVKNAIKREGWKINPNGRGVCETALFIPSQGIEVRRAFENCNGTKFEEISRVDRPADRKALTIEILKSAAAISLAPLTIQEETELLIKKAKLEGDKMAKSARKKQIKTAVDVNVPEGMKVVLVKDEQNGQPEGHDHADGDNAEGGDAADGKSLDEVTHDETHPEEDQGESTPEEFGMLPVGAGMESEGGMDMSADADDDMPSMDEEMPPMSDNDDSADMDMTADADMDSDMSADMDDGTGVVAANGDEDEIYDEDDDALPEMSDEDGAEQWEGEDEDMKNLDKPKFASVYDNLEVDTSPTHVVVSSPSGAIMRIKSAQLLPTDKAQFLFGTRVLHTIMEQGLVRTASEYKAEFSKRFANAGALEGAMFNFAGGLPVPSGNGSLEGSVFAQTERQKDPSNLVEAPGAIEGIEFDHEFKSKPPKDSIEDRETDMKGLEPHSPKETSLDEYFENMKSDRPKWKDTNNSLDGGTTDMKANAGAGKKSGAVANTASTGDIERLEKRLKALYSARLAAAKQEHAEEIELVKTAEKEKIFRALRVAHRRAALNIECSPLKASMFDSLTVTRPVGRCASTGADIEFQGLDEALSLRLLADAWSRSASEDLDALLERTAELMEYDDKYLVSAERDLSKQAAIVPQVTNSGQVSAPDETQSRAAMMRQAAEAGNLDFTPIQAEPHVADDDRYSRRAMIREVVQSTNLSKKLKVLERN